MSEKGKQKGCKPRRGRKAARPAKAAAAGRKAGRHGAPGPRIDPEFQEVCTQLTADEQEMLRLKMLADQVCRVSVWKGYNILLEGREALKINEQLDLPLRVDEVELADRQAARDWVIYNQLGRANLSPEAKSYLRGRLYNEAKQGHGGDRRSADSSGNECRLKTAEAVACLQAVSEKTVRNDGAFAEALDTIREKVGGGDKAGDEFVQAVLSREVRLTRGQVGQLAQKPPEELKKELPKLVADGRVARPPKPPAEKITVPVEPAALARELMRRHGPSYVEEVRAALALALAEHRAKHAPGAA